jgi:hypothetical protein
MQEQTQTSSSRSNNCLLIVVLLIVLLGAVLYAAAQNRADSGGSGYSFEQTEAFHLAQETQDYRRTHPFKGNYALGSITIFFQGGLQRRFVPLKHGVIVPFPNQGRIHSENFAHDWILDELASLQKAGYIDHQTTAITVVIFSQVAICTPCKIVMRDWQREFGQAAHYPGLGLSVWQLTQGYDPQYTPKGQPVVSEEDVTQVIIRFA